jgi:formylglycine-generating enzyme required for sulfatase activity
LADRDDTTVPEIHKRILAELKEKSPSEMKPYTNSIPGTAIAYEMVPIPGGEFVMGSPESEKDRKPDEGPQHKVKISPFWIGRYEVTWDQYLLYMYPDDEKKLRETFPTPEEINQISDAVTRPSKPYVDMSFGMGKTARSGGKGFPAIAMTQHGANKFCHWLSAKTGHFYRLPTEAEWEYACRAGTTTAYSFGDDMDKLPEYAWFFDNSNSKYQEVGKKKPNPWGLYDMHGNVTEWVLDQLTPDFYKLCAEKGVVPDPWNRAIKPYPHGVRGGSWDDDPHALRSAARRGSDRTWKMQDPQLPKSIWYLTDAQIVGFRLVRPLEVPPPEDLLKYWTSGVEKD